MLAMLACIGFAQVASYTFGYSAGTYTEITGGTVLATATEGGTGVTSLDNNTYPNISIPFYFPFNGRQYNQVSVNSNGYLIFGGVSSISETTPLSTTATCDGVISPYGKDNQGIVLAGSLGEIRYQTIGSAPDRTFVIQWKNFRDYGATGDILNFQIHLGENKQIKFVYGNITIVNSDVCQVGLRGTATSDFLNRTSTTSWTTTSAGTVNTATISVSTTLNPGLGTTFTFTPPAVSAAPNVATVVSPANAATNVFATSTLNWADGGGWTNGFKLYFGTTDPAPYVGDLGYVTSYDPPGDMTYNTPYYWKVVPYNGFGENTAGTQWTFTTAGAPLTGTKTIGATGADYATFTAAINALNGAGVGTGGVTFNVADGTYNESPPAITVSGTAANQIKFQAVAGANPVVTPAGGTGTFGFKLTAADYVTFDNIDVTGPNTLIYGYWLAANTSDGATNNTIKNCTITVPYGSSTNYGIYSLGVASGANSNLTILNNTIVSPYNGVYLSASSGSEAQTLNVQNNTVTGIRNYGVYMYYAQNSIIQYNNIGFYAGGTTSYNGIYLYGSSSSVNVHHNTISGGYTSSYIYGIYNYYSSSTFDNNTISSLYNTSSSAWYGFYDNYGGTTTWTNNQITNITNTGTASFYGLYPYYATNSTWSGNTVSNVTITSGTMYTAYMYYTTTSSFHDNILTGLSGTGSIYGYYVASGTTNTAYNNKIYNLNYAGTGSGIVYGLYVSSGTTNSIYNNMVYDLRAAGSTATAPQIRGLAIAGGTTDNIWNNTVYLNASGSNTAFSTAALYVSSGTTIDLKNNIFVNNSTSGATGKAVAFWKTTASVGNLSTTSNKNIYFAGETPGAANLIGYFNTTAYPTLAEYKTMAVTVDQGSYTENVPFIRNTDPYNLHIDPAITTRVEGNAIPIVPPVSFDIDNQARSASMPDIGADEGTFTAPAGAPGLVALSAPTDSATGVNPISGQLSWNPPTTGGAPAEYWVYVSTSLSTIYDESFTVVALPNTSLTLANVAGLAVGFNSTYYWAVQASNIDGQSNENDPSFQIWSFTTVKQMSAATTLDLGNVWPGDRKPGTIAIQNLGTTPLSFTATGSAQFDIDVPSQIPGNSTYNLPFTFNAPSTTGAYNGTITLTQTSPLPGSTIVVNVTATISTDIVVGTGTTEFPLPVDPYFGYSYSQTIYYPSELNYPAGNRIEKLYYYFNGYETCTNTKDFVIYMGHTTNSAFASTTDWIPVSGLTQVYAGTNIPQLAAGGYWMEFVLSTPFVYNGTSNLVIAVDENFPSFNSSSSFFYGTSSTVNRSIRYINDSTNPDPAAPPVGTLVLGYPNTKFMVGPVPLSPQILVTPASKDFGTVMINTTNNQVFTIQNTGMGDLVINGITPASSGMFTLTNLPASFPVNLTTGQSTTFTVRYLPTAAGSHNATFTIDDNLVDFAVNVNGVCVDPTISSFPYNEGFESVTAPAMPLGWTVIDNNADGDKWITANSTTYARTGTNSAQIYTDYNAANDDYLVTPPVVLSGNKELRFWARSRTTGEPDEISVLLSTTTPTVAAFTNVLMPSTNLPLATYSEFVVNLSAYTGTCYISFTRSNTPASGDGYYLNLDDIMIRDVPTAPIFSYTPNTLSFGTVNANNPTAYQNVTVTNIGVGTLDLRASDISLIGTDPTQFGFTTTTGFPAALTAGQSVNIPVRFNPTTIGTKTATLRISYNSINYDVALSGTAIGEFALYESFEGTTFPPAGWSAENYWYSSTSYAYQGTKSCYRSTGATAVKLITPTLAVTPSTVLSFNTYVVSSTYQKIQLSYFDGTTWTNFGTEISLTPAAWQNHNITLTGLTGNYKFGIGAYYGTGGSGASVYVDMVSGPEKAALRPDPVTQNTPADLAVDQAIRPTLTWTPNTTGIGGTPTGYKVYCGPLNPPVTLVATVTTSTYTLTSNLNYSSVYYWMIVANNNAGDAAGSTVRSFTTIADPSITSFPYVESFDGTTFAPNGWTNVKTGGTGTPGIWDRQTTGTSPTIAAPFSGAGMIRYNSFSLAAGTKGELSTPPINFPGNNYQVKFMMYRDYSTSYPSHADLVNVYYNTTNSSVGGTLLGTINRSRTLEPVVTTDDGWYEYVFDMPNGSMGIGRYIIFEAVSAYGNNMFIDHVTIQQIPIVNLATPVVNIETVGANVLLSWAVIPNATQYIISSSSDPYTGFTQLATTSNLNYTVTAPAAIKKFYQVKASNAPLASPPVKAPLSLEEQLRKDAIERRGKF